MEKPDMISDLSNYKAHTISWLLSVGKQTSKTFLIDPAMMHLTHIWNYMPWTSMGEGVTGISTREPSWKVGMPSFCFLDLQLIQSGGKQTRSQDRREHYDSIKQCNATLETMCFIRNCHQKTLCLLFHSFIHKFINLSLS